MISGETRRFCLIGDPVEHSLSPFIINRAFDEHGYDGVYVACRVKSDRAEEAVHGLRVLGFRGANITYPLKEEVQRVAGGSSRAVDIIGAANTLRFVGGNIEAYNTDASGTARALETFADVDLPGRRVFIFGAGGSGRAAAYGLLEAGAESITFGLRDVGKPRPAIERLGHAFPDRELKVFPLLEQRGRSALIQELAGVNIVINATPVGMIGSEGSSWVDDESGLGADHCCFEFVYHPRTTAFLETARRAGATAVDGLALLVAQARDALMLWTGIQFALTEMYEAASAHLQQRQQSSE